MQQTLGRGRRVGRARGDLACEEARLLQWILRNARHETEPHLVRVGGGGEVGGCGEVVRARARRGQVVRVRGGGGKGEWWRWGRCRWWWVGGFGRHRLRRVEDSACQRELECDVPGHELPQRHGGGHVGDEAPFGLHHLVRVRLRLRLRVMVRVRLRVRLRLRMALTTWLPSPRSGRQVRRRAGPRRARSGSHRPGRRRAWPR